MRRHINRYGRMPSSAESSASDDDDGSNGSVPSSVGGSPSSSSTSSQTQPSSCFSFPSQSLPEDVEHSSASSFSSERDNVDDRLSDRSDSDEDLSTRPLYEGCPIDVRTFLAEIFMWKAKHKGISQAAISNLLTLIGSCGIISRKNTVPKTFREAKKCIQHLLVKPEKYDMCRKGCMLFRGEDVNKLECDTCGSRRFKPTWQEKKALEKIHILSTYSTF